MKARDWVPWLLAGMVVGCDPKLEGITDQEIRQSGLEQGIAGRAVWLVGGDCMPGASCLPGNEPTIDAPYEALWVVADAPAPFECVGSGLTPPAGVLANADLTKGTFFVPLAVGRYRLLAVDEKGCPGCYPPSWEVDDAGLRRCKVVEVLAGQVTKVDDLENHCPE